MNKASRRDELVSALMTPRSVYFTKSGMWPTSETEWMKHTRIDGPYYFPFAQLLSLAIDELRQFKD